MGKNSFFAFFMASYGTSQGIPGDHIDNAVANVLTTKRIKLAHPGDGKLSELYANPDLCTSILAEAVTNRGQIRVSPTGTATFGSQSSFQISSSAIISDIVISGQLLRQKSTFFSHCGWAFDMIDTMEITMSNSLMQSMILRGETLKDLAIASCRSEREVRDMLNAAGRVCGSANDPIATKTAGSCYSGGFFRSGDKGTGDTGYVENAQLDVLADSEANAASQASYFAIPLSFLNNWPNGNDGQFPMDYSVLAGPVQINVNWRTNGSGVVNIPMVVRATSGTACNSNTLVPTIQNLQLTAKSVVLQDASFSVKKAMLMDPSLIYAIPSRYITTIAETIQLAEYDGATGKLPKKVINLNSLPSGMLEALVISIKPDDWVPAENRCLSWYREDYSGTAAVNTDVPSGQTPLDLDAMYRMPIMCGSLPLHSLRLTFGGQNLVRFDNPAEYRQFQRSAFGRDLTYPSCVCAGDVLTFVSRLTSDGAGPTVERWEQFSAFAAREECHIIPLVNNARKVFQELLNENVPSYGGAQLQLELEIGAYYPHVVVPPMGDATALIDDSIEHFMANDGTIDQNHGARSCPMFLKSMNQLHSVYTTNALNVTAAIPGLSAVRVTIGYVISSILEVTQGTVDLQL